MQLFVNCYSIACSSMCCCSVFFVYKYKRLHISKTKIKFIIKSTSSKLNFDAVDIFHWIIHHLFILFKNFFFMLGNASRKPIKPIKMHISI